MPIFRGKQIVSSNSDYKDSVRVAQRTNLNLTASVTEIDGVTLNNSDRVLLAGQVVPSYNGIYVWNSSTSRLSRATDADSTIEVTSGTRVYVEEGTLDSHSTWVMITTGAIVIGVTPQSWVRDDQLHQTDSDDVVEGSTNLFYTNARARNAISVTGNGSYNSSTGVINMTNSVVSVNSKTGIVVLTTTDIAEGTNLYYTDARAQAAITAGLGITVTNGVVASTITQYTDSLARAAVSASGSLAYNSSTGVFSYTAPTLATVATSGSYSDLSNAPTAISAFANDSRYLTTVGARLALSAAAGLSYNNFTGVFSNTITQYTDELATAAARSAISVVGGSYNNATGVITITNNVVSVAGKTGAVTLNTSDVSEDTNLYFTTSRAITACENLTVDGGEY